MFRFQINKSFLDTTLKAFGCTQQIRNFRFRKPPWVPRSKKAQFRVPVQQVPNLEEKAYMKPIWDEYKAHMRSMYQLFKTEYKFSSKESIMAKEELRIAQEKEQDVLRRNDEMNAEILRQQMKDEDEKLKLKIADAEKKLYEKIQIEELYRQEANEKVKALKEKAKKFINPNNLDYEIEKMLNERVDYNFSVDSSGRFWKNKTLINHADIFDPKYKTKDQLSENIQPETVKDVQNNVKNIE